jgi:hypothetical protein
MAKAFPQVGQQAAPADHASTWSCWPASRRRGSTYYMTPKYTRVGYAPIQPVPFSHKKHVGELGLDCRYCHNTIDTAGASIPTAQTCMNCHSQIKTASPALAGRAGQLPDGPADPVGPRPRDAELRLLRPFDPREPRHQLRRMPRQGERDGRRHAGEADEHGLLPGLPPGPRGARPREGRRLQPGLPRRSPRRRASRPAGPFVHDWNIKPPQSCSGCHR